MKGWTRKPDSDRSSTLVHELPVIGRWEKEKQLPRGHLGNKPKIQKAGLSSDSQEWYRQRHRSNSDTLVRNTVFHHSNLTLPISSSRVQFELVSAKTCMWWTQIGAKELVLIAEAHMSRTKCRLYHHSPWLLARPFHQIPKDSALADTRVYQEWTSKRRIARAQLKKQPRLQAFVHTIQTLISEI